MKAGDRVRHMDGLREGVILEFRKLGADYPPEALISWEEGSPAEWLAVGYLEPIEQPGKVTP